MTRGKQWSTMALPLDDVRVRRDFQFRVDGLNLPNLNRLRGTLQDGGDARDPVDVARVGNALYLVDGFHRHEAYRLERRATIPARVAKMSLEEAREYARLANAANGKPLSRADKQALWEAYVTEGRHLDEDGVPRSASVIAGELGHVYSRETVRLKLRGMGLQLDDGVEYEGAYKSRRSSEELLEGERLMEAEEALGSLGGLLVTLGRPDQERLVGLARDLLDAVERGDDPAREEALRSLREGPLDI